VPDYRKLLVEHHANLVGELFVQLSDRGSIDHDWLAQQIRRSDDIAGDIDALLQRMEAVRTWTYVSSHARWVSDAEHFREAAQGVEDRLSDALHQALVERFVERGRKARRRPVAPPDHPFGALATLRSALDGDAPETDAIEPLVDAEHSRFRADASGKILDAETGRAIAVLTRGPDPLHPEVRLALDLASSGARSRLQRRLVAWARDLVSELFAPLRGPELAELSGPARGLVYQLEQSLGTVLADDARAQLDALDERDRRLLASAGVELGSVVVFVRPLLRRPELEKRAALVTAYARSEIVLPAPGAVSVAVGERAPRAAYLALGFPVFGPRAIRADVAERVHRAVTATEPEPDVLARAASSFGCKRADAEKVLRELAPGVALPRPRRTRRRATAPRA
jgi:ATP-dependent RNA helicase SUPV3L1/SUV3